MEQKKTTAIKATETVKRVRSMVKTMNTSALEAKASGIPVAYCMTSSQYDELIVAMGIVPVWTENFAGLCAAKRDAERFLVKAESEKYAHVICGYTRTGLGFDALRCELGNMPPNAADGGMAEPDMLLGSSCGCDPRYKWYQALGRYKDTPIYCFDVVWPAVDADLNEIRPYYVKYQLEQLRGLVDFVERQTGKKLNYDRLEETFAEGQETWRLWYEVDQLRKAVPSPMPSQDHFNAMVPATFLCGTKEATNFYRDLCEEVKHRVENKTGVIEKEKYRMLWGGGLPPWHTLWIFNYFESVGAVFAMENGYRVFDPVEIPSHVRDPLEKLAWRTFERFSQRYDQAKKRSGNPTVEKILEYIDNYQIDGMIFHASISCRAMTIGQIHMRNLSQEYSKVPSILLVSDIIDIRDYSEAEWRSAIGNLMEMVETHKKSK